MGENLEVQIRKLQELYWSDSDPEGRRFVPLAELFRRVGDLSEARRILRDGLGRHAELASGHVVLGWVLLDQGDATEAEASFRAALAVDPGNIRALKGLGDLLVERDEVVEALDVHRALHRLDPLDPEVPERLEELEARVEALARAPEPPELDEEFKAEEEASVWDDGEEVAESLDWDVAFLQADSSLEEGTELLDSEEEPSGPGSDPDPTPALGTAPGKDALVTRTMGEIYLRQGLLEEARSVFQDLLNQNPEDEILQARLQEVEDREVDQNFGAVQETAPRPPSLPIGRAGEEPEDVFGEEPEDAFGEEPEDALPVEALAPDTIVPAGDLAPDTVIPVADLAPDFIASMADLAPDVVVPISALAPDVIVPIWDLAPDGPSEDQALDTFEAWLDNLQ